MVLSRNTLSLLRDSGADVPTDALFALPERVLQFGTGVLLRGLPDYFIHKANKAGIFNGRVVVVKSTGNGGTDNFAAQDGLFTHSIRGIQGGEPVSETVINASISRVLSAASDWAEVLSLATRAELQIVVSNTTEVGLTLLPSDNIFAAPPQSFPAKLTAVLLARYNALGGTAESGMVILPTELIPENGDLLKDLCVHHARAANLPEEFVTWLTTANDFCNTLVDCIVPGALPAEEEAAAAKTRGYADALHITSEAFRLWAIETSRPRTRKLLSFATADEGVVVCDNIQKFRELKLRLLNAAHTFTCGLAVLSDFSTVKEAMGNSFFEEFIEGLMLEEIVPTITGNSITRAEAEAFARRVLDRFRNPYIEHPWLNISAQYTSKMQMRCVPLLQEYSRRMRAVPNRMAAGFAAYCVFAKPARVAGERYTGRACGKTYTITDDAAHILAGHWDGATPEAAVRGILSDHRLWFTDLTALPGFEKAVCASVRKFLEGAAAVPARVAAPQITVPA